MKGIDATNYLIKQIISQDFIRRHKSKAQDFTRNRSLSFKILFVTILRKSVKSLQLVMNELFMDNHIRNIVTASAYTQARKKLRYTAFKALSDDIVSMQYADPKEIKLWKSYRLLGVDASKIILPNTAEISEEFGSVRIKNQNEEGSYNSALFECCYDLLNNLVIEGILCKGSTYEVDLAIKILPAAKDNDILIYDRGYCSYKFLAILLHQKKNFIIRCQRNCFKAADELFSGQSVMKVVTMTAPRSCHQEFKELGLQLEVSVKFVAVTLSTGEIEVLVTSITDQDFTTEDFKELYGLRWGVESFFGVLKGRLSLENFTGLSVESVKQDFWSTILISNYETIITFDSNQELQRNAIAQKPERKVNKAVAFNIIKHRAFDILFSKNTENIETITQKLQALFKTAAIPKREERNPLRKKPSAKRSYNFLLRKKKHVF